MPDTTSRSPLRIFVVEDDANDLALTLRTLGSCCPERIVTIFPDGKDVIDHLGRIRENSGDTVVPDVVLLDLKLPRVSGIEVLQWLRANPATQRLPVVVLTSARDDRQILALHRLGIVAYLEKPLTAKEFQRALSGILPGVAPVRG